jgi:hypothetical protein
MKKERKEGKTPGKKEQKDRSPNKRRHSKANTTSAYLMIQDQHWNEEPSQGFEG